VVRRLVRRATRRVVDRVLAQAPQAAGVPVAEERRATRAHAVASAASGALSALVWVMVFVAVCGVLGLDLGPVIASAGLAGIALAFGAQSLIKDLLGGLLILLEDHFGIGDEVDLGEAVGVVESITLRQTVLRDLDGTVWHVPNGEIERVGNRSQLWSAALVDVAVVHGTDLAAARAVLLQVATAVATSPGFAEDVLDPPEVLGVQALTAEGVVLRLRVRTAAGTQFGLQRALLEAVDGAFSRHGIELAAPQLTVRMHRTAPQEVP
jgi:moderate conductance mechanosensitive channel